MVKLFALSVFYKTSSEARLLKSAYDLQSFSFFQRGSVQEFIGYVILIKNDLRKKSLNDPMS